MGVVEEKAEKMVAGQDINFGMVHALGKEKEGRQKGQKCQKYQEGGEEGKEAKERDQEPEPRPRAMSAGAASSWKLKRKKKSKEEAAQCTRSKIAHQQDLRPEKLLVWSDIDWARKAWN